MTDTALRPPTSADVLRAQRLAGHSFGPSAISRILRSEGVDVSRFSVSRWLGRSRSPQQHRDQARRRRAQSPDSLRMPQTRTPEWKAARMCLLAEEGGLSLHAIAAVMAVDFPDDPHMSKWQMRELLNARGVFTAGQGRCHNHHGRLASNLRLPGKRGEVPDPNYDPAA